MTKRNGLAVFVAAILAITVFATLIGPIPGFFIGGQPTPVPKAWHDTSKGDEILLKVPGTLRRVVIIWVVQVDRALYVVGSRSGGWVQRIADGANVEMRLSGNTYALAAVHMKQELERVVIAYKNKYRSDFSDIVAGFPTLEEAGDQFGVFRLDTR